MSEEEIRAILKTNGKKDTESEEKVKELVDKAKDIYTKTKEAT